MTFNIHFTTPLKNHIHAPTLPYNTALPACTCNFFKSEDRRRDFTVIHLVFSIIFCFLIGSDPNVDLPAEKKLNMNRWHELFFWKIFESPYKSL